MPLENQGIRHNSISYLHIQNVVRMRGHKVGSDPMQARKLNLGGPRVSPFQPANHCTSSRNLPIRPTCSQEAPRCQHRCFKAASQARSDRPYSGNSLVGGPHRGRGSRGVATRAISGQVRPGLHPSSRSSRRRRVVCAVSGGTLSSVERHTTIGAYPLSDGLPVHDVGRCLCTY